jgi:hypothetical protein
MGFSNAMTARCLAIEGILATAAESDQELSPRPTATPSNSTRTRPRALPRRSGFRFSGNRRCRGTVDVPHGCTTALVGRPPRIEALLDEMEDALDECA